MEDRNLFQNATAMTSEQRVRLARYTFTGSGKSKKEEGLQKDFIGSLFRIVPAAAQSLTEKAVKEGLIDQASVTLKHYQDLIQKDWFKDLLYLGMNTGQNLWVPSIGQGVYPESWWTFPGSFEEGAVASDELMGLLNDFRTNQKSNARTVREGTGVPISTSMQTVGCPVRHTEIIYSDKPNDINYLTPHQVERLTEGPDSPVIINQEDPHKLRVANRALSPYLNIYSQALEVVTQRRQAA